MTDASAIAAQVAAAFSDIEALARQYRDAADAAERDLEVVRGLRLQVQRISEELESEQVRLVRAAGRFAAETEKLRKHGGLAVQRLQAAGPLPVSTPPVVRRLVAHVPTMRHQLASAAESYSDSADRVTGIYFLLNGRDVVYVGQSVDVGGRVLAHRRDPSKVFDRACYVPAKADELDSLEQAFIAMLRPALNRMHVPQLSEGAASALLMKAAP